MSKYSAPAHAQAAGTAHDPLPTLLGLAYEVLGIQCDPDENFFDYGDSMAATQMCGLAAREHGWTITPRDVFAWESFALLAGVIERDRAAGATPGRGAA